MQKLTILNLTQHAATKEQKKQGVFDITDASTKMRLTNALTFINLPSTKELQEHAQELVKIASENTNETEQVLIGGAPFFMPVLNASLVRNGFTPLYAFSKRESTEITKADGTVAKISSFKHLGFVEG